MILWTFQPKEVLDIINTEGKFHCTPQSSLCYREFSNAYNWLVEQMLSRSILPPDNVTLPIWAWHTYNSKQIKPILEDTDNTDICIELDVPDSEVLLSDYNAWHYILNNSWFDDSRSSDEWEYLHEWYSALPYNEQERLKLISWQKVFDIVPESNDWFTKGAYVQATFWEISKDMIRHIYTDKE